MSILREKIIDRTSSILKNIKALSFLNYKTINLDYALFYSFINRLTRLAILRVRDDIRYKFGCR